jgi:sugar/nucleoside kinase (ribokinase family)
MVQKIYDVLGIGNAIVDVIARASDNFLDTHQLPKGAMRLIDEEEAERLYRAMGPAVERSGGSVANSIASLAALGRRTAYIGKVAADQLGEIFRHDLEAQGVQFSSQPLQQGPATARSFIFVTPDGERTMNTFLGACTQLGPEDVVANDIAQSRLVYLEGYLWDKPRAKAAVTRTATLARQAGAKVALSLSDRFCVERHRQDFIALIRDHIDLLFANEGEILSLSGHSDLSQAMADIGPLVELLIVTRGGEGSLIRPQDGKIIPISAEPAAQIVDTTGAGDLYAAGFLAGYSAGASWQDCGIIASLAAAEVISHIGARADSDLKALVRNRLGAVLE